MGRPTAALLCFALAMLAAASVAPRLAPDLAARDASRALVFFFAMLPILNALADFASVGLTRWLLRRGVRGHVALNASIDAAAALAILVGLGFATIAVVHLARAPGAPGLIDLGALFADLRDPAAAHDYYWLYFCFFSTLLPTALHAGVGAFGLFTLVSERLGRNIAAGLASGSETEGRMASDALTLCAALAVWAPAFLLWQAVALFGRPLLDALLWLMEGFALGIGAV